MKEKSSKQRMHFLLMISPASAVTGSKNMLGVWSLSPEQLMEDVVSVTEVVCFRWFWFWNQNKPIKCQASLLAGKSNALVFLGGGAALSKNRTTRVGVGTCTFPAAQMRVSFLWRAQPAKRGFCLLTCMGIVLFVCVCVCSQIISTLTSA